MSTQVSRVTNIISKADKIWGVQINSGVINIQKIIIGGSNKLGGNKCSKNDNEVQMNSGVKMCSQINGEVHIITFFTPRSLQYSDYLIFGSEI